jgi:hypothetical protein
VFNRGVEVLGDDFRWKQHVAVFTSMLQLTAGMVISLQSRRERRYFSAAGLRRHASVPRADR